MNSHAKQRQKAERALSAFVSTLSRADLPATIARILVYGSHARGDFGPNSDLDVAVVLEGSAGKNAQAAKEAIRQQTLAVRGEHGYVLSHLVIWEDQLTEASKGKYPGFYENVLRESIEWEQTGVHQLP